MIICHGVKIAPALPANPVRTVTAVNGANILYPASLRDHFSPTSNRLDGHRPLADHHP
jgi:hypothetical protein